MLTWKENRPENVVLARSISKDLANIVAIGQKEHLVQAEKGYGNYGTLI